MRFLKAKLLPLLTLMLCAGVFSFPARASGASAPAALAWITGDTLYIEARGGQGGIEAAFINDARVNYRVDGKLELPIRSYAGTGQYVTIYAVDFAGNQSAAVQLLNPFYVPPSVTPPPATTAPTPKPTPAPVSQPTPMTTSEPTVEPQAADPPSQPNPFTPQGTGDVMDNATDGDGKEFFTVGTAEGDTFYLIVDRQRNDDNVYLLNTVTDQDLMALAEKNGTVKATPEPTAPPATPSPTPQPTPEPTPTPTAEPEPPKTKPANDNGMYITIAIAVIGAGGAGYYFKIVRGGKNAPGSGEDEYEDEYGYTDETEGEDETDDSELDDDEE